MSDRHDQQSLLKCLPGRKPSQGEEESEPKECGYRLYNISSCMDYIMDEKLILYSPWS